MCPALFGSVREDFRKRSIVPRSLSISLGIQKAFLWANPTLFSAWVTCSGSEAEINVSAPLLLRTWMPGLPGRSLSISLGIQKALLWADPTLFSAWVTCSGSEAEINVSAPLLSRIWMPGLPGRSLSISLGIQKAFLWADPTLFSAWVTCSGSEAEINVSAPLLSRTWMPGLPGRSLSISLGIQKALLWADPTLFSAWVTCSGSEAEINVSAPLLSRTWMPGLPGRSLSISLGQRRAQCFLT
jgi:phage-related protein